MAWVRAASHTAIEQYRRYRDGVTLVLTRQVRCVMSVNGPLLQPPQLSRAKRQTPPSHLNTLLGPCARARRVGRRSADSDSPSQDVSQTRASVERPRTAVDNRASRHSVESSRLRSNADRQKLHNTSRSCGRRPVWPPGHPGLAPRLLACLFRRKLNLQVTSSQHTHSSCGPPAVCLRSKVVASKRILPTQWTRCCEATQYFSSNADMRTH